MSDVAIPAPNRMSRRGATHYAADIRQQAFLLWMWECDSDVGKTAFQLMQRELADARNEDRQPRKVPNYDTLWRWHREENWPAKRHEALTANNTYRALGDHAIGKLLLALDKATTRHIQILDLPLTEPVLDKDGFYVGERPSNALPSIIKAMQMSYEVAKIIGRVEGDPAPKLEPPRGRVLTEGRTAEQISKERMERNQASKTPRRGKH